MFCYKVIDLRSSETTLKRVDAETESLLNELQALLAARNIRLSHKDIIKWAVMFARTHILEFFRFINGVEEDGLKRFIRKVVEEGPKSNSVAEHDLVI